MHQIVSKETGEYIYEGSYSQCCSKLAEMREHWNFDILPKNYTAEEMGDTQLAQENY